MIDDWGFEEPSHMKVKRLRVHIQDLGETVKGLTSVPYGIDGATYVATEQRFREDTETVSRTLHLARAAAGHELFSHLPESHLPEILSWPRGGGRSRDRRRRRDALAPGSDRLLVFLMSTGSISISTAISSAMSPPDHWRLPVSANTAPVPDNEASRQRESRKQSDRLRAYQASLFFQYLTENCPRGNKLIKDIFDRMNDQNVPDVWDVIMGALGEEDWGGLVRSHISGFAGATLVQSPTHHPDLSFDQLGDG